MLTGCTSPQPLTRRQQPFQSPFRPNAGPAPVEIVCTSALRLVDLVRVQSRTPVPPLHRTALCCTVARRDWKTESPTHPPTSPFPFPFPFPFLFPVSDSVPLSLPSHLTSPHLIHVPSQFLFSSYSIRRVGREGILTDSFAHSFIHPTPVHPPTHPDCRTRSGFPGLHHHTHTLSISVRLHQT